MGRSDEWIEAAEVLLQDALLTTLEYDADTEVVFCHFCDANQDDVSLPLRPCFMREADDAHQRHHDNCWVLRVERLLKR